MNIEIKGWPAIIILVLVALGAIGYRTFLSQKASSDPDLANRLELHLLSEIAGDQLADMKLLQAANASDDIEAAARIADDTLQRSVQIVSIATKGSGKNVILKVEYNVFGPQDTENKTEFFRFEHSPITGWRHKGSTTAFSWYTKLL